MFSEVFLADESRRHLDIVSYHPPFSIWKCQPVELNAPIELEVINPGKVVDYDNVSFSIDVVSRRMADIIASFADNEIQRLPAVLDGDVENWEVLNILSHVDCIDYDQSEATFYPDNHPEKPGKPRGFTRLVIDIDRARGHHIFRPVDWEVALIVSDELRIAMESTGITGLEFLPVAL